MAEGRSKYSSSMSCQTPCGHGVIPHSSLEPWRGRKILLLWPTSWPAAASPPYLAALTSPPRAAGEEKMPFTPLILAGWHQPPHNCLLPSWLKYWLVIARFFCNTNCFHACLAICLNGAQINLMSQCLWTLISWTSNNDKMMNSCMLQFKLLLQINFETIP